SMLPVAISAEGSPLTVAGAAAAWRVQTRTRAPRSLLIPCGNHRSPSSARARNPSSSRFAQTPPAAIRVPTHREPLMARDFEDHCWKDVIDADTIEIYKAYRRKIHVGDNPAVLA